MFVHFVQNRPPQVCNSWSAEIYLFYSLETQRILSPRGSSSLIHMVWDFLAKANSHTKPSTNAQHTTSADYWYCWLITDFGKSIEQCIEFCKSRSVTSTFNNVEMIPKMVNLKSTELCNALYRKSTGKSCERCVTHVTSLFSNITCLITYILIWQDLIMTTQLFFLPLCLAK